MTPGCGPSEGTGNGSKEEPDCLAQSASERAVPPSAFSRARPGSHFPLLDLMHPTLKSASSFILNGTTALDDRNRV